MSGYSSYQPSNMTWCNTIPAEWKMNRLKVLFSERKESNSPVKTTEILSLTNTRGVIPYAQKGNIGNKSKDNIEAYHLAYPGDLVVNCMNVVIGSVGISKYFGAVSPVYYTLSSKGVNARYYEYIFKLPTFEESIKGLGNGILEIRMRIPMVKLNNVVFPVPSRNEQDQIVRYLDWQVSKINKLIAAKRKQITLNKERAKVLVSDLVIHGLSKNAVAKESGVEWIGKIPSNWEVLRCKYLFSERDERSKDGSETHLSMSQKHGLIPDSELDERRMLSASYAGGKLCYENDLVLNRLKAHLGVFALAPQLGVISPDYTVLIPNTKRIVPQYAEAVLKSDLCRRELRIRVRGIIEGFWRLYTDDFYTIKLPVPSIDEQNEIMAQVSVIQRQAKAFEAAIQKEIDVLSEMRNRLISDVVTGQIDVRGVNIPEYDYVVDSSDEEESEDDEEVTELEQDE